MTMNKTYLGHPVLHNMMKFGCDQVQMFLAFQTYIELCEVKKLQEVDYCYCPELDLIYLTSLVNGEKELYVPLALKDSISPKRIKTVQDVLSRDLKGKEINLVLRDVDTSSVIYKITSGLEKPISPEASKENKDVKEKRNLIEIDISRLFPSLVEQARNNCQLKT